MRLTRKCQVTIPRDIRKAIGVGPGSEVEFRHENGEVKLVAVNDGPPGETAGERVVRTLRETGRRLRAEGKVLDLTTDEIMEMTRGPFDDVDPR